MTLELKGLHHVTAGTAEIRENKRFYTDTMGMRLVKRSVNQDDVSSYHLFYADKEGSPGSDLTFFDWTGMPPVRPGTRSISRTTLRVPDPSSLAWWQDYLREHGLDVGDVYDETGHPAFDFSDPEGMRLRLVADEAPTNVPWETSSVPLEHAIRGLGFIELTVPRLEPTAAVLTRVLYMAPVREYHLSHLDRPVTVFRMGGEGSHAEVHVIERTDVAPERLGGGGVHHVAFRTPNEESIIQWLSHLNEFRIPNSGLVDRFWFKSLYFREAAGILFEIATDTPGFAVDEDPEHLGESLVLPPFLEPRRASIEAGLIPID